MLWDQLTPEMKKKVKEAMLNEINEIYGKEGLPDDISDELHARYTKPQEYFEDLQNSIGTDHLFPLEDI